MALISLLAELYHHAELKLNLKFEIEVLCKALDINLDSVEATQIIRLRPREGISSFNREVQTGGMSDGLMQDSVMLAQTDNQRAMSSDIEAMLSALSLQVHINPQLSPLNVNQSFKQAVQVAVDQSVRDVRFSFVVISHDTHVMTDYHACCRTLCNHCWHFYARAGHQGLCD